MRKPAIVLVALTTCSVIPFPLTVAAQEAGNGRFSMSPTAEGYLKLDSRTGEVTECRRNGDQGYRCTLTPDERSALQGEIDRLAADNTALKSALKDKGMEPPAGGRDAVSPSGPSDQDFDRAMSLMERFMRRFMAVMKESEAKPPANP